MLHLQKEDVDDSRTTKPNTDKIPRKKRPKSNTAPRSDRCWDEAPEDQRRENDTTSVTLIQSTENRLDEDERVDSVPFTDDGVHPESDLPSQQECLECLLDPCVQQDESSDLQHMFYQSEQNVSPKRCRHNLTTRAFQMILANVKELLSRSPPQGFDFSLPDLSVPPDEPFSEAFQVTFSLAPVNGEREECDALSPGWDELFDDDDKDFTKAEEQQEEQVSLDESVDLFGDDEAFLQLSVPDVRTPDKSTGPDGKQQTPVDVSGNRSNSAGSDQAFNCSQDFFSVNFDLGFESEEEECVNTGAGNITVSALKASPAVSSTRPHPVEGNGRSDRSPLVSDQWSPVPRPSASTPNHVFLPPAGRRAEDQTRPSARRSFQKTLSQRSKMFQQRLSCAGGMIAFSSQLSRV